MTVSHNKVRRPFTISKEVADALRKHVALEVATGTRESAYGAESEVVEEALRMILGLPQTEKEGAADDE